MHWTHCGGTIFEKDQFCGTCGNNLLNSNVEAPSETEAPDLLKAFVGEYKESYYLGNGQKTNDDHGTGKLSVLRFSGSFIGKCISMY